MIVKLLTEHHLEFLSLKRGCRGPSESTQVKMPHCWKSHVLALIHGKCYKISNTSCLSKTRKKKNSADTDQTASS